MSAAPEAPTGGAEVQRAGQGVKNCWSCRLISGGGLIAAGVYVFNAARGMTRHGGPTSTGTVVQFMFAACLAAWGVVVITDPVGKAQRKT